MKKTLAAALMMSAGLLSAAAYAGSNVDPDNVPFQGVYGQNDSGVTRAQVRAELAQAKAQGLVSNVDPDNVPFQAAADNGPTRAQVRADLAQARAEGLVTNVEPDNVPFMAQAAIPQAVAQE